MIKTNVRQTSEGLGLETIAGDVELSFLTSAVTASVSADAQEGHLGARVLHGHR